MARPKKEYTLVNLTFRVDPLLMETFHKHCEASHTNRSEAFRQIFNTYMVTNLNLHKHENDFIQISTD
jgi:hypothetical protein